MVLNSEIRTVPVNGKMTLKFSDPESDTRMNRIGHLCHHPLAFVRLRMSFCSTIPMESWTYHSADFKHKVISKDQKCIYLEFGTIMPPIIAAYALCAQIKIIATIILFKCASRVKFCEFVIFFSLSIRATSISQNVKFLSFGVSLIDNIIKCSTFPQNHIVASHAVGAWRLTRVILWHFGSISAPCDNNKTFSPRGTYPPNPVLLFFCLFAVSAQKWGEKVKKSPQMCLSSVYVDAACELEKWQNPKTPSILFDDFTDEIITQNINDKMKANKRNGRRRRRRAAAEVRTAHSKCSENTKYHYITVVDVASRAAQCVMWDRFIGISKQ